METIDDRLRHAERTLNKLRDLTPRERELAVLRLAKMRAEIEADRDELNLLIDEGYEDLPPWKEERYPVNYERFFNDWIGSVAKYERVCDILGEIDRVIAKDRGVNDEKVGKEAHQADDGATGYRAQPLLSVDRRAG